MKNLNLVVIIAVAIIAAAGGFFGGIQYQKGKQPATPTFARAGFGNFNGNINGLRARFGGDVRGNITAISGQTVTVKLSNGGSKIVLLTDTTTVDKTVSGATSDLAVGNTVNVIGTSNSDGSVTATTVQLNPAQLGTPPGGTAPTPAQ